MSNYRIITGKSQEKLKEIPSCSIDSIVTDGPYELGFMEQSWDKTGIAYNVDFWREALRVLKPGGKWVCWEPNQALLATLFRKLFQKTDRFSHLHHSFFDYELFKML